MDRLKSKSFWAMIAIALSPLVKAYLTDGNVEAAIEPALSALVAGVFGILQKQPGRKPVKSPLEID